MLELFVMALKLMKVYIKCHHILRTLQGDLEDTEL